MKGFREPLYLHRPVSTRVKTTTV